MGRSTNDNNKNDLTAGSNHQKLHAAIYKAASEGGRSSRHDHDGLPRLKDLGRRL